MKDLKELFESTLKLDEEDGLRFKPGTELTVDMDGEDVVVTVIKADEKGERVQVKTSDGKAWYPMSAVKESVDLDEGYTSNELGKLKSDETINIQVRDFDGNKTKWLGLNDKEALMAFKKFVDQRIKSVAKK